MIDPNLMPPDAAPMAVGAGGELACLAAAALWAVAVAWFRGPIDRYGAWTVNLVKNGIAATLFGLTVLAVGQGPALLSAPGLAIAFIVASGVAGFAIGDTALFASVGRLGPHRALLLQTFSPVFAALLARIAFAEVLGVERLAGATLILLGVALVVLGPPGSRGGGRQSTLGTVYGVLAALGQGSGVVLSKVGLEEVPVLASSFVRLLAGVLGLAVILAIGGKLAPALRSVSERRAVLAIAPPSIFGTYLGVILMMTGIARAPASIAAVLLATSPIFSLLVDRFAFGEPITWRGVVGTLTVVVGVRWITIV